MTSDRPPNAGPDPNTEPKRRKLYGRRRGRRLRTSQRDLAERLLPRLEIVPDPDVQTLVPAALFAPDVRKVWLEIGFGGGEHLAFQALANPDVGFIGCEPFTNGVVKLLRQVDDRSLANVRLYCDDARLLLAKLPEACLDRVFILYPDPWPKSRHHKRRIVCPAVLSRLENAMRDAAELRMATDDEEYLQWILAHMSTFPEFVWTAQRPRDWRIRPDDWPQTRYGQKALAAGRDSWYLRFVRRPRKVSTKHNEGLSFSA